jgi:tetratricopeptide (TPR) repeat protein
MRRNSVTIGRKTPAPHEKPKPQLTYSNSVGDVEQSRELIEKATSLLGSSPAEARELANRVEGAAAALGDIALRGRALYVSGSASCSLGDYPRADEELQRALDYATECGDTRQRVLILRTMLKCAFFTRKSDEALRRGMDALELARACGDDTLEALTHNDLGLVYGNLSDFEGALEHLLEGLRILREAGTPKLGTLLNNIGNVYLELEDHAEALTFFRNAAEA